MFQVFKQVGDLRRADKIDKAMGIGTSASAAGQMEVAYYQLEAAYKLCLETTFVRTPIEGRIGTGGETVSALEIRFANVAILG